MRIYVIGPVSGFDDLNFPAFQRARRRLRAAGYIPLIPHDFVSEDADWQKAMRVSIETLAKADGVAYLPRWQSSRGARLECEIARALGIEFASVDSWCAAGGRIDAMERRARERMACPACKRTLPTGLFDASAWTEPGKQGLCRDCVDEGKQANGKECEACPKS